VVTGHPSAAGRAYDRKSSPVTDRRSTTVPRTIKSSLEVASTSFATFSSTDLELWPVTLTFQLDLGNVKMNHYARYPVMLSDTKSPKFCRRDRQQNVDLETESETKPSRPRQLWCRYQSGLEGHVVQKLLSVHCTTLHTDTHLPGRLLSLDHCNSWWCRWMCRYSLTQIAVDWGVCAADRLYYDVLFIGTGRLFRLSSELLESSPLLLAITSTTIKCSRRRHTSPPLPPPGQLDKMRRLWFLLTRSIMLKDDVIHKTGST